MLLSRYVTFYKSLISSNKFSVSFLAKLSEKDNRTVLGKTLEYLCDQCEVVLENLTSQCVKKNIRYHDVPEVEQWRVPLATELLQVRSGSMSIPGFSSSEIKSFLDFTCTS